MVRSDELPVTVAPVGRNQLIAELFGRRNAELLGLARTLVDSREEAEEVVQEAFTRLVASYIRLEDSGKADHYVTGSVLNLARSRLRRRRTSRAKAPGLASNMARDADDHEPHDRPLDEHTREAIRAAVGELPRRQQQCVVLRFYSNLTEQQIAATLGISAGSVKVHLSRGRAALAERVKGLR